MASCSNDEKNPNDNFLKKFKNDDFTKFSGNSFFVRGFDKGNPIVFVYSDECKHPLVITVNSQTNTILKTSKHLQIDTCNINTTQKEMLTLSFLKYNINYLEVDKNLDVFINVMFEENPPQLARITNPEKIKGNWKKIIDNWYELRK
ncbi:hypothetical protein VB264_14395 [Arcicella aquatica]|uniref:Uncharacterized protein n=1 Tax=Arcicella aquatica TaxID=217141 RepID=A0ABU5QPH0_9BACT|nr:hypothetical protein [Arcicella aquatica]MEA5258982.1 hypothetical protein [Arcicella aquatica]